MAKEYDLVRGVVKGDVVGIARRVGDSTLFLRCYDPGSDFSACLLTGYDYGTPQVSSHISHGQSSQSAE